MAWAMDRLGRSLVDLLNTLSTLEEARVDLFLHQQAIDTTTPAGRMFFQILGSFAEFERGIIRSRVNAGLARARARGVKLTAIRARLAAGTGVLKVARELGVGTSVEQRFKAAGANRAAD